MARLGGDAKTFCKRTWWVFLLGGIAGVIFGVLKIIFALRVRNLPERVANASG